MPLPTRIRDAARLPSSRRRRPQRDPREQATHRPDRHGRRDEIIGTTKRQVRSVGSQGGDCPGRAGFVSPAGQPRRLASSVGAPHLSDHATDPAQARGHHDDQTRQRHGRFDRHAAAIGASSARTGPIGADPIDTGPIDTDPIDTDPIDTDPIDTDPIDTDPIDRSG